MSAVIVIGFLFPGGPMLVLGILLARAEAHHGWLKTWRLRREVQWAQETCERLEKTWKRVKRSRSKLLIPDPNQIPLSICIDGRLEVVAPVEILPPIRVFNGEATLDNQKAA